MSKYPKGSEWRRWDLHLHTPDTARNDNFTGTSSDNKWSNFARDINGYANDISVVGITDYFSVDNYKKFIALIDSGAITKHFDLVLPNVELRITPVTGDNTPINIHCIFNPDIVDQLETRFFAKLEIKTAASNYRYSRSDLIRLGKAQLSTATDDEAYKLGREQFVISHSDLVQVFKDDEELRKDTIIVISNNSGDGASGIHSHEDYLTAGGSQLNATRRVLYQLSDMIFSAQPNDRIFFLGQKTSPEDVMQKCGRLKACVHGCDAHTNAKIFEPDDSRYCWIKADPTFEGLRQIIDEPESRVYIGEYPPIEKEDYRVIDSVSIADKRFPDSITINPDLVSIIGSRSSGKSTLLTHIAHSINARQVVDKIDEFKPWAANLKVRWRDGHISPDDDTGGDGREIIFIPQGYINNLADSRDSSEAEILKFAESAIASRGDDFEVKKKELDRQVRELSQSINIKITALFNAISDRAILRGKAAKAGDKKGIEEEIKKLTKTIEDSSVKITPEEMVEYREATDELAKLETERGQIEKDTITLSRLAKEFDVNDSIFPANLHIEHPVLEKAIETQLAQSLEKANKEVREKAAEQLKWALARGREVAVSTRAIMLKTKVIRGKLSKNEDIKKQMSLLQKQKDALGTIVKLEEDIKELDVQIVSTKDSLIQTWSERRGLRYTFSEGVSKKDIDGVEFSALVTPDNNRLLTFANGYINQREVAEARDVIDKDIVTAEGGFNPALLIKPENIEKSLKAVANGKLHLKSGIEKENAVKQLFSDYEYVSYKITFENDEYAQMTPGKKALVVLKLILESSKERCPVLIDQPEDDLDSRSIFDAVVPFIREKKKERQIILVSHNANMAVTTDSEQVIVANRHGNNSPNTAELAFDYLSGSIEDTKIKDKSCPTVLESQGVREHVCDILEGSEKAFALRRGRYSIK